MKPTSETSTSSCSATTDEGGGHEGQKSSTFAEQTPSFSEDQISNTHEDGASVSPSKTRGPPALEKALQGAESSEDGVETQEKPMGAQHPNLQTKEPAHQGETSPERVLDAAMSGGGDSDSTGSSESTGPADRPSSPITEPSHGSQWRSLISGFLHRGKVKSKTKDSAMRRLSTFPPVNTKCLRSTERIAKTKLGEEHQNEFELERNPQLDKWKPSWRSFSYQELAIATDNFSSENLIGRGGHAEVYKGCMSDGQLVAVKRLMKEDMEEKVGDFLSELGVIAHVKHPNAACLLGFGVDGGLHLVLKFSPHGSLASALHGSEKKLGWETRYRIALGVAEGLLYLHEGCHRRIIHRDIKASNILLTEDFVPQISDFGLAKWLPERWSHHVVFPIEGTFGYLAPEYFMHGIASEKTDVFALGVLFLELITGRRAVDSNRQSLVIWAKPLLDVKDREGLIDPCLKGAYNLEEMNRTVFAASVCIHHLPTFRPHMKQVVQLLKGDETMLMVGRDALKQPIVGVGCRPLLLPSSDFEGENYTPTKYLNDLNRYKQLAMEQ